MPRAQAEPGISTPHVLERDAELTALGGAVERVRDGLGGWLLIEGSAGVGKSRLLASARASAEEAGLPVLGARGAARAGVRLRCGAEAVRAADRRRHGGRAPGSRRRGGLAARLVGEDGPEIVAQDGDAAFGALHGLYCLTVNLADRGPLVLVADDAHWADPPSLRFLGYLSRRLEGLPVLLLAAARVPDPESEGLLRELASDPAAEVLCPRALSAPAAAQVLRSRLGREVDEGFSSACHRATGGNPLFLRELVTALAGLIPAVMTLVGKASWWMPSWLGRRLPRISIEGEDHFAKQPVAAPGQS